jgi:hypothetical protein
MVAFNQLTKNILLALSAISILQLPVSATTLSGHLEEQQQISPAQQAGATSRAFPAAPAVSDLDPNTFPKTYTGTWSSQTTVVDSTAPQVLAGQVINSDVVFYPTSDGRVQARWNQPGWVETQTVASSFGKDHSEAKSDRTTYYFGENAQGSWAARARDQFALTAPDTITAKSYVDQYIDGQYVGRYRTVSVLKRTSSDPTVASR